MGLWGVGQWIDCAALTLCLIGGWWGSSQCLWQLTALLSRSRWFTWCVSVGWWSAEWNVGRWSEKETRVWSPCNHRTAHPPWGSGRSNQQWLLFCMHTLTQWRLIRTASVFIIYRKQTEPSVCVLHFFSLSLCFWLCGLLLALSLSFSISLLSYTRIKPKVFTLSSHRR